MVIMININIIILYDNDLLLFIEQRESLSNDIKRYIESCRR
jgi:hypothetical protein